MNSIGFKQVSQQLTKGKEKINKQLFKNSPDLQNRFIHSMLASVLSCGAFLFHSHLLMLHFFLLRRPYSLITRVTIIWPSPLSCQQPCRCCIIIPAITCSLLWFHLSASWSFIALFRSRSITIKSMFLWLRAIQLTWLILWTQLSHCHKQNSKITLITTQNNPINAPDGNDL